VCVCVCVCAFNKQRIWPRLQKGCPGITPKYCTATAHLPLLFDLAHYGMTHLSGWQLRWRVNVLLWFLFTFAYTHLTRLISIRWKVTDVPFTPQLNVETVH